MPIYEETYRSWEGSLIPRPRTWRVIGKTGVRLLWKKGMILFILLAYIPFFVRAVQIYLMTRFGEGTPLAEAVKGLEINAGFFHGFLQGQWLYLILILIFAGAGLVANDRKYNALTIYFSKPVGFWDYASGKLLVIAFYGALVTLVPAWLLFLIKVMVSQDAAFLNQYYYIPFSILAYFLMVIASLGMLILALSAAARSTRSAAVFYFAVLTFPEIIRGILSRIPEAGLFSLNAVLKQAGAGLFGVSRPYAFSPIPAWIVLIGVSVLSVLILHWRVRPTEVIQ